MQFGVKPDLVHLDGDQVVALNPTAAEIWHLISERLAID